MKVTAPGRSGLRNAYRSVASICGSAATRGASRWLDAWPIPGPRPETNPPPRATTAPAAIAALRKRFVIDNEVPPVSGCVAGTVAPTAGRSGLLVTSPSDGHGTFAACRRPDQSICRGRPGGTGSGRVIGPPSRDPGGSEEPPEHHGDAGGKGQGETRG